MFVVILLYFSLPSLYSRDVKVDVEKYCKMPCPIPGTVHTICEFKCQIAPNCLNFREYELDETERRLMVKYHNEFRNRLASGADTRGGNTNAKDMLELQYDPEIELAVSCWGRRCFFGHDACRQTLSHKTAGQNLYIQSSSVPINVKDKTHLYESVKTWYGEIANMKPQFARQYTSPPQKVIGHFTQVVWASTEFIGCTRVTWTSTEGLKYKLHILCNYSPAGNVLGRSIYARGTGCSRGLVRSQSYPSLCARGNSRRATASPPAQPSSLKSSVLFRQVTTPTPSSTKPLPPKLGWHGGIIACLILIATNVKNFFFVNIEL